MKKLFACLTFLIVGCASAEYGRLLDQCALDHRHDPQGRADCQCAVAQDAGRSCDKFRVDAGQDAEQDAAKDTAQDAGAE